jgi:hypothetical protein
MGTENCFLIFTDTTSGDPHAPNPWREASKKKFEFFLAAILGESWRSSIRVNPAVLRVQSVSGS